MQSRFFYAVIARSGSDVAISVEADVVAVWRLLRLRLAMTDKHDAKASRLHVFKNFICHSEPFAFAILREPFAPQNDKLFYLPPEGMGGQASSEDLFPLGYGEGES